jgi:hypothetical protein
MASRPEQQEKKRIAQRKKYGQTEVERRNYLLEYTASRREALRAYLRDYKESKPCEDCDISYPSRVMEFHHTNGDKEYTIASMPGKGVALATLEREIAKCILLCANCHRLREIDASS